MNKVDAEIPDHASWNSDCVAGPPVPLKALPDDMEERSILQPQTLTLGKE